MVLPVLCAPANWKFLPSLDLIKATMDSGTNSSGGIHRIANYFGNPRSPRKLLCISSKKKPTNANWKFLLRLKLGSDLIRNNGGLTALPGLIWMDSKLLWPPRLCAPFAMIHYLQHMRASQLQLLLVEPSFLGPLIVTGTAAPYPSSS